MIRLLRGDLRFDLEPTSGIVLGTFNIAQISALDFPFSTSSRASNTGMFRQALWMRRES